MCQVLCGLTYCAPVHIFVDKLGHILPPVMLLYKFQSFGFSRMPCSHCVMMHFDDGSSDEIVFWDTYVTISSGDSVEVCPFS